MRRSSVGRFLQQKFESGQITTAFLSQFETELVQSDTLQESLRADAAVALVARELAGFGKTYGTVEEELRFKKPGEVWRQSIGFRLNAPASEKVAFAVGKDPIQSVRLPGGWQEHLISAEETSGGLVIFDEGDSLFVRTEARGTGDRTAFMTARLRRRCPGG